jgi:predicted methyltransferase
MYNQIMCDTILNKYGVEKAIDFCQMMSEANQEVYNVLNSEKDRVYETCMDYGYDALWWREKGAALLRERNERVFNVSSGRNVY